MKALRSLFHTVLSLRLAPPPNPVTPQPPITWVRNLNMIECVECMEWIRTNCPVSMADPDYGEDMRGTVHSRLAYASTYVDMYRNDPSLANIHVGTMPLRLSDAQERVMLKLTWG